MKKSILLAFFALSLVCVSCLKQPEQAAATEQQQETTEQQINNLLDQVQKLINDKEDPTSAAKLAEVEQKLSSFKESDFTPEQMDRLARLVKISITTNE